MFTLFVFLSALICEIYVIWVACEVKMRVTYIIAVLQGLNVIWQFIRLIGLLP